MNAKIALIGLCEFSLDSQFKDLAYLAVQMLDSSSERYRTMPRDRERQILSQLRELWRVESRLQSNFERLPAAGKEARASFLFSLAEWRNRAQQLESLLDAIDVV